MTRKTVALGAGTAPLSPPVAAPPLARAGGGAEPLGPAVGQPVRGAHAAVRKPVAVQLVDVAGPGHERLLRPPVERVAVGVRIAYAVVLLAAGAPGQPEPVGSCRPTQCRPTQ